MQPLGGQWRLQLIGRNASWPAVGRARTDWQPRNAAGCLAFRLAGQLRHPHFPTDHAMPFLGVPTLGVPTPVVFTPTFRSFPPANLLASTHPPVRPHPSTDYPADSPTPPPPTPTLACRPARSPARARSLLIRRPHLAAALQLVIRVWSLPDFVAFRARMTSSWRHANSVSSGSFLSKNLGAA